MAEARRRLVRRFTRACRMPHTLPCAAEQVELTLVIANWRTRVQELARFWSRGDFDLRQELEQHGLIALWELGVEQLESRSDESVNHELHTRMRTARRGEWRSRRRCAGDAIEEYAS